MTLKYDEQSLQEQKYWINQAYELQDKIAYFQSIAYDKRQSEEIREKVKSEIEELKKEFQELLMKAKDSKEKLTKLIYYRYFEGYTLEDVSLMMGYSIQHIKRVHSSFKHFIEQQHIQMQGEKQVNRVSCQHCGKLLLKSKKVFEASLNDCEIEIKCTKCKAINYYKTK